MTISEALRYNNIIKKLLNHEEISISKYKLNINIIKKYEEYYDIIEYLHDSFVYNNDKDIIINNFLDNGGFLNECKKLHNEYNMNIITEINTKRIYKELSENDDYLYSKNDGYTKGFDGYLYLESKDINNIDYIHEFYHPKTDIRNYVDDKNIKNIVLIHDPHFSNLVNKNHLYFAFVLKRDKYEVNEIIDLYDYMYDLLNSKKYTLKVMYISEIKINMNNMNKNTINVNGGNNNIGHDNTINIGKKITNSNVSINKKINNDKKDNFLLKILKFIFPFLFNKFVN